MSAIKLSEFQSVFNAILKTVPFSIPTSKVGIAMNGDADSLALCSLLAEKFGPENVYGYTVAHSLKEYNVKDAEYTNRIATSKIEWDPAMTLNMKFKALLNVRFQLMAKECYKDGVKLLCLGNYLEDDFAKFCYRSAKSSRFEGLCSLKSLTHYPEPNIKEAEDMYVVRPFLSTSIERLIATCKERGIEYNPEVYDPDKLAQVTLNALEEILEKYPEITRSDLQSFMSNMKDRRFEFDKQIMTLIDKNTILNTKDGYATLAVTSDLISRKNDNLLRQSLNKLCQVFSADSTPVKLASLDRMVENIHFGFEKYLQKPSNLRPVDNIKPSQGGRCALQAMPLKHYKNFRSFRFSFGLPKYGLVLMTLSRIPPRTSDRSRTNFKLFVEFGKEYNYDNRFNFVFEKTSDAPFSDGINFHVQILKPTHLRMFVDTYPDSQEAKLALKLLETLPLVAMSSHPVLVNDEHKFVCFPTFGIQGPKKYLNITVDRICGRIAKSKLRIYQ
ncbi:hypothetical protein O9G_000109 [Rozella allomycis CSF55]|uniref:tRNA(Ile)-lysidine/2-thiocytidine synthase N-terminal domain-containing protein n=1 Tax=Rozella allomycis (strain CSF55) TaxID=988480 RepID=A0A075ANU9_ROZAC|nr:hypothetical protein O9G_000109 [Rozella allomycis CSF55]|eukprot:EPZ31630.1 hypothetical protein O9G_000109 [Rozella allomycis CSF55]